MGASVVVTVDVVVRSSVVVTATVVDVDGSVGAASVVVVDVDALAARGDVSSVGGSWAASEPPHAETTSTTTAIACISLVIATPAASDLRSARSVSGSSFSSTRQRADRVELLIGHGEGGYGIGVGVPSDALTMYSTDLTTISLESFEETILTIDLLPSRRLLADGISAVVPGLSRMGVENLEDLRRLLRDKRRYADLAAGLGVDETYLAVLNREVNAYVSKALPLAQLGALTDQELQRLKKAGITSTRALFERCLLVSERVSLSANLGIDDDRLDLAVDLSDLVRINGVGPSFARFLRDLGVCGPHDFNSIDATDVLDRYHESIAGASTPGPRLRLEDLEYCRRFSLHLSNDVER